MVRLARGGRGALRTSGAPVSVLVGGRVGRTGRGSTPLAGRCSGASGAARCPRRCPPCPSAPSSPVRPKRPLQTRTPPRWQVQPGETLGGIARQLVREGMPGTTAELVRTLARLNGIENPDHIEVGQVLTLPRCASAPAAERGHGGGRRSRHAARDGRCRSSMPPVDTACSRARCCALTRGLTAPAASGHPRRAATARRSFVRGTRRGGPSDWGSRVRAPRSPTPVAR